MSSTDLTGGVLKSVSRSFYLSIRVLPAPVRQPIGLAYLLARASDTIADSTTSPADVRLQHLASFERMIREGTEGGVSELQADIRPQHQGEQELLSRLDECLQALRRSDEPDRSEIQRVLADIIRGQTLDLQRFGSEGSGIRALNTVGELEEYTYLVAGCVGGFWTRINLLHFPDYSRTEAAELVRTGTDFGKGLQLVNILRDLPEDLRNGRCYLPAEELANAGVTPDTLLAAPETARSVFNRWLARADALIDSGRQYVAAIRPVRSRLACYLPWHIGRETLHLLRKTPPLETPTRVKVPRATVRKAFFRGLVAGFSNRPLRGPAHAARDTAS